MPAPKKPNNVNANAARRRIGDRTATNRLTAAGYTVIPPGALDRFTLDAVPTECIALTCQCGVDVADATGATLADLVRIALAHTCPET